MSDDDDLNAAPIAIDKVRASKAGHAYHEIMSHSVVYLTAVVTELFRRVPG